MTSRPEPHEPGVDSSRPRRVLRGFGRGLLLLVAVYLVVRAAVEPFVVNPFRPDSYRRDWGGPHYLGVLLVHCGPGLMIVILAARRWRDRHRRAVGPEGSR